MIPATTELNGGKDEDCSISAEKWLKTIKKLEIDTIYVRGGSDPLLYSDIDNFLINVGSKKRRIYLYCNGEYVYKHIEAIEQGVYQLIVNLNGIGETHNKIAGVKNSYEQVIYGIEELVKSGFKNIRFSFNIQPENIADMSKVCDLAKKYKATVIFNHNNNCSHNIADKSKEIDTIELFRQIKLCPNAYFSPVLKNLDELDEFYKHGKQTTKKRCQIVEKSMSGEIYSMVSSGNFRISDKCWNEMVSESPIYNSREFIQFYARLKFGLPDKCKCSSCFYDFGRVF